MSPLIRSAVITLAALALSSCAVHEGNGVVVTQERAVTAFTRVRVESGIRASIGRGERQVTVTTDENLQQFLQVVMDGNTLILRTVPNFTLRPTTHLFAEVHNDVLVGLTASGGSQVSADATEANEWRLAASGGSTVALSRLEAQQLIIDGSGGSHVDVFGLAPSVIVDASGGSQINTDGVAAQDVTLNASGGSILQVRASRSVQGNASGGSQVTVSGNPANRGIDTSGGSRVTFASD